MKILRKEIAESWLRSKAFGVNPFANETGFKLEEQEIKKILKENEILINTAIPYMTNMENILFPKDSGYVFVLADSQGVTLFDCGDPKMLNDRLEYNAMPGFVWSEKIMGTCATAGFNKTRRPVQVNYYEHYNHGLKDITASAAPIFRDDGSLAGSLCIISDQNDNHPHTLGLVTATAWSIQNQLTLRLKNQELNLSNAILNETLATTKDGLLTINPAGNVILANEIAIKSLNLDMPKTLGIPIEEILGPQPCIHKVLSEGKPIDDLEITTNNKGNKSYFLLSIHPIYNDTSIKGAVISIQPIEKINKIVTSRSGAVANFTFENIIGNSLQLAEAITQAKSIANVPASIHICGESGTGKELFAQAIHNASRRSGPFVAVNCAALPRSLVESELIGYEGVLLPGLKNMAVRVNLNWPMEEHYFMMKLETCH
jgi:transcriptional regulator of acetoin/glycerol metabolism